MKAEKIRKLVPCTPGAGALEASPRDFAIFGAVLSGAIDLLKFTLLIVLATILGVLGCEPPLEASSSEGI